MERPNLNRSLILPPQVEGGPCRLLDRDTANLVMKAVQDWLNCIIAQPVSDGTNETGINYADIKHNDFGALITLPSVTPGTPGSSGSSRVFAGAGAPTQALLAAAAAAMGVAAIFINALNPDLYVDTAGKALYYCSVAGTDVTSAWTGLVGSSTLTGCTITAVTNSNTFSTDIGPVSKPTGAKLIAGEIIDTVPITYTNFDDNNRLASDGTNTEFQVMFPRYAVGQSIIAAKANDGLFYEVKPARVWARRFNQ
jgi:hypothetical protein